MFQPQNIDDGKHQVVGDCNGIPMQERWDNETPIFRDIILKQAKDAKVILDYGCGVGRLAKEILEANRKVKVIGVDNSEGMLKEASRYILSDRFIPKLPQELDEKVDFAYAVYVLQHIPALELRESIQRIANASNKLLLVNSVVRMAVSGEGFVNDGINVLDETVRHFTKFKSTIPFKHIVNNSVMRQMFLDGNTLHYGVIMEK